MENPIIAKEYIYVPQEYRQCSFGKSLGTNRIFVYFENEKGEHKSFPVSEEYNANSVSIDELPLENSEFKRYVLIYK